MDVGIDPRLQQPFFNGTEFPFPNSAGSSQYGDTIQHYAFDQQLNSNAVPTNAAAAARINSSNERSNHGSPQTRPRNKQVPQQNVSSQTPKQQELPQRKNTSTPKTAAGFVFKNSSSNLPSGGVMTGNDPDMSMYLPLSTLQQSNINQDNYFSNDQPPQRPTVPEPPALTGDSSGAANPFNDKLALVSEPSNLEEWRTRLFNITQPLHLSESEFLTYFPHVDNIYSHRSTQKYKRKPFVSHYWDCRLKGRPSGTKKSEDPNKKKRKREKRERDLCDVKIKITEWFSREECDAQSLPHPSEGGLDMGNDNDGLQIVMDTNVAPDPDSAFGMLEPAKRFPAGHPGAEGKKWYTIQRVNNAAEDALEPTDGSHILDHKHTLEDSDRIKKNSVQRWQLALEKSNRQSTRGTKPSRTDGASAAANKNYASLPYFASGAAARTSTLHRSPVASHLVFYANAYCPFAQRVWIALEIKDVPYQYVEIVPDHVLVSAQTPNLSSGPDGPGNRPKELLDVNPEGIIPCIKHGNWGIWESGIMMEYLEDLEGYLPLLPVGSGSAQLRAHCRLWVDHLNRKVLPAFYALLLTPPPSPTFSAGQAQTPEGYPATSSVSDETHSVLITTLQKQITSLVNASHAIGPFFLGTSISYVDVAFAPWIIRLSRVLSYYRNFPRPEVGTRWQRWVEAIESDDRIRRTISSDDSYHHIYRGVGEDGWDGKGSDAGWHSHKGEYRAQGMLPGLVAAAQSDETPAPGVTQGIRARLEQTQFNKSGTEGRELGRMSKKVMVEAAYARKVLREEGFGLGGDDWGKMGLDPAN